MAKVIKQLGYEAKFYPEKGFYFFIVHCPLGSEALMSTEDFVIGMYAQKDALMLESEHVIFSLRELSSEYIKDFKRKKPFYFRIIDTNKEVLNVLALNPITA